MSFPNQKNTSSTPPVPEKSDSTKKTKGFAIGISITLLLALLAGTIAHFPIFSIMGIMIISILLGMVWKAMFGVPATATSGITFSSKILLRAGIILMGLRLNFSQIIDAGFSIVWIDIIVIVFTLTVMIYLGKLLAVDKHLTALIAVGTAVCGAAAIVAIAPLIQAKKEFTAIAVAFIAILGTIGTIVYTLVYPLINIGDYSYGVLVGSTLHELAHVIAAAVPGGDESGEIAILVKLGRVALLIPVAMILGFLYQPNRDLSVKKGFKDLPVPWFIFGFLGMCLVNTLGILPNQLTMLLISLSVYLLSMAMAGLGLSINFGDFKKVGFRAVFVGVLGFILLAAIGPFLLYLD